jgi:uroporphyrin-III C-methyltransferase
VWLVGSGPGDAGLMTLAGYRALQEADHVVYDALVGDDVLKLAGAQAALEYAGKRGGRPSPRQADISHRLVQLARAGSRVLRLKGGDPFVFGRGGEEALSLVEAGVPFRVVPGISAGIGGLAYAGVPVTHREIASAVTFLTGHGVSGEVPDGLDWRGIARGSPVIVAYMAMKHLGTIARNLIDAGRPADQPVAVVCRASTDGQQVLETTLADAPADVQASGLKPPAVVVIGEVVRLRAGLDWLGALTGRILVSDPLGTRRTRETG